MMSDPSRNPILRGFTKDQGDAFKASADALAAMAINLKSMSPEEVSAAHSVLEAHKLAVKYLGYKGGVQNFRKEMTVD